MQKRAINITFHGVGDRPRAVDAGEARVWLELDDFEAVLDSVATQRDVRITFDDGNASDLEHALPALRSRGLDATFFVVAGRLGEPGFLDRDGVRTLASSGMTIGCHGMHHQRWRGLDDAALREELVEARGVLEDVAGAPVTTAACPFGAYDRRVLTALRRCGYRRVFTSDRGIARPEEWVQARNTLRQGEDAAVLDDIRAAGRRRSHLLRRRAKLMVKRWR